MSIVSLKTLLTPIPGPSPSGSDPRGGALYQSLKGDKKLQDDRLQGLDQDNKPTDWNLIVRKASELLARNAKDLEVATWLTHALVHLHGFEGLYEGLQLIRRLDEEFPDNVFPDDPDSRLACFEGVAQRLVLHALRTCPLTANVNGVTGSFYDWDLASRLAPGARITKEQFETAAAKTDKEQWIVTGSHMDHCLRELDALEARVREHYPDEAGDDFAIYELRATLKNCIELVNNYRPIPEPEPEETPEGETETAEDDKGQAVVDEEEQPQPSVWASDSGRSSAGQFSTPAPVSLPFRRVTEDREELGADVPAEQDAFTGAPESLEQVPSFIAGLTSFLRQKHPNHPWAYALPRAMHRASLVGQDLKPALLPAPSSRLRAELRSLYAARKFSELLLLTEHAMNGPAGLAWLDLSYYAHQALTALGAPYRSSADVVLSETRALLQACPALPTLQLSDGTPVAEPRTLEWLKTSGVLSSLPRAESDASEGNPDSLPLPLALSRFGQILAAASCGRERFMIQLRIAEACLLAKQPDLARPILTDLVAQVDARKLEEWESPELSARVWQAVLMLQVGGKPPLSQDKLFERLCKTDIVRAQQLLNRITTETPK